MKKILVTGGGGFIGSHLCKFLLEKGNQVICVDNFFTGNKRNILELMDNPGFELICQDITQSFSVEVDQIYNLACPASPKAYQSDAVKTVKCSTIGMLNVLDIAQKNNARILQASTSEIYGDPIMHPQKECYLGNVNPGIRSCYNEGKRVAECLCMDYYRMHNVDVRIARIFNTYGPNMDEDDGRVVSNFIMQALENKPITIYGDGKQTRSFQYVEDLVIALYKLMNSKFKDPVNLGNPSEISMLELAKKVIELTESRSELVFMDRPLDDVQQRKPDIALAKEKLGWEPQIILDIGLQQTIDYF